MKSLICACGVVLGLAAGCSSAEPDVRVALPDQRDPSVELDVAHKENEGVDLGPLSPGEGLAFCDAFAAVPSRWLNDAVVPLQFWIDSFDTAHDVPAAAAEPLAALQGYAEQRLAWNFGRAERPEFTPALAESAKELADAAVDVCPELPLILGRPDDAHVSPPWFDPDEMTAAEIADRCRADAERVQSGIDAFVANYRERPVHLEQIEAGLYFDGYYSSEIHGIGDDGGRSVPVPVPAGPCA